MNEFTFRICFILLCVFVCVFLSVLLYAPTYCCRSFVRRRHSIGKVFVLDAHLRILVPFHLENSLRWAWEIFSILTKRRSTHTQHLLSLSLSLKSYWKYELKVWYSCEVLFSLLLLTLMRSDSYIFYISTGQSHAILPPNGCSLFQRKHQAKSLVVCMCVCVCAVSPSLSLSTPHHLCVYVVQCHYTINADRTINMSKMFNKVIPLNQAI